jgi:hypothetical protein
MITAEINRQLMIRVSNEVGTLAEVTSAISAYGINMIAVCAYAVDDTVAMMFVTEDNNEARKILEAKGLNVEEQEVVLVALDNRPGALQNVTGKIAAAGIDLKLMYGSVDPESKICRNVLVSDNNLDVVMVIKTELSRG